MKNLRIQNCGLIWCAFIFAFNSFMANAQKLPNIQQNSLRTPVDLKIDGRAQEWNNQFQAHNNATSLFYTLANDDENLYLAVQATDPRIIEKIMDVGVTLVINTKGRKTNSDADNIIISFPLIQYKYAHGVLVNAGDKAYWSGRPRKTFTQSEVLTRTDSSVISANRVFNNNAKTIKITGAKGITDTIISIYNDQHIKAAAQFNNSGVYMYELLLPLKYINPSIDYSRPLNYCIRLNSFDHPFLSSFRDPVTRENMDGDPDLNSITEFLGEYTLAKKP